MITSTLLTEDASTYLEHISDPALLEALRHSDIVILPDRVEPEDGAVVFGPGAKDLLDYLAAQPGLRVEIATEEDRYIEKLLHASDIWLPTLLLLSPLAHEVGIVAAAHYILDKLKGLTKSHRDQTTVRAKILVNQSKGITTFTYNGPAGAFESVMRAAITKGSDGQ